MRGALSEVPGLYSAVLEPLDQVLWWVRPKPWPASWAAASAMALSPKGSLEGKTKALLGSAGSTKEEMIPTPPASVSAVSQAPSPPITTVKLTLWTDVEGAMVVTLRLKGENFSATRA